jgi:hypothetical protein
VPYTLCQSLVAEEACLLSQGWKVAREDWPRA